jgi:hypothetical protein
MKPDVIFIPGFLTCGEADALLGQRYRASRRSTARR